MKTHIKSLVTLAVTVSTLVAAPAMAKGTRLDIQSAWPLTMPASGANAAYLGETLNESSGGSLDVTVYGAGKLVPSLQIFDAVQQGTLDAGITSPLYVAGRFPAVQLFGGIPFGPDAITHTAWLYDGGGREIWSEIYAKQGVVTIPCGLMDSEAGAGTISRSTRSMISKAKNCVLPGWQAKRWPRSARPSCFCRVARFIRVLKKG